MPPIDRMKKKVAELMKGGCSRDEAISRVINEVGKKNKQADSLLNLKHKLELMEFENE